MIDIINYVLARKAAKDVADKKFYELSAAQQQDAEVILARTSGIKDKTFSNLTDRLEEIEQDSKLHSINNMPHQFKNLQTNKTYQFGFQISSDGKPQIIYEEVI